MSTGAFQRECRKQEARLVTFRTSRPEQLRRERKRGQGQHRETVTARAKGREGHQSRRRSNAEIVATTAANKGDALTAAAPDPPGPGEADAIGTYALTPAEPAMYAEPGLALASCKMYSSGKSGTVMGVTTFARSLVNIP